ncbi:MAG: YIP1 family protein [Myxococcota bacterium]
MTPARTPMHLRLVRCARLHADTYEEVEADHTAIGQAFLVVVVAAVAATVGGWLETFTWHAGGYESAFALGLELAARAIEPVLFWLGGAAFAYMVGSSFFRGPETETDYAEVLRTTGFAFAPGWLACLVFVPPAGLGTGVLWLVRLWTLLAFTIAVRQALDFTTGRAIGTVVFGWAIGWLVMWGAVSVTLQLLDLLG